MNHIPVIDITHLERPATHTALAQACRDWGFFQAVGHGLDMDLAERLMAVTRAFFNQPAADKRRLLRDADHPFGYFDQELTKNRRDWKEIYDHVPADAEWLQRCWPADGLREHFVAALDSYHAKCTSLAHRLLAVMLQNLGADPTMPLSSFDGAHTSFLRLNHYPACDDPAAGAALGVGEHTDSGALTLLLQDRQPGLEVQRHGRWHGVPPLPGALVVNIGDIVQVWSNDRYRAGLHRVLTNPTQDRYSAAFFFNPCSDTVYAPLAAAESPPAPAHYQPISWREFRAMRAAGDYADLGEEVQISHYRRDARGIDGRERGPEES